MKKTVMGILVIRRTRAVYSAVRHGKLATVTLYATIFIHLIWYDVPQPVSALLAGLGAACILLSMIPYTLANLKRLENA